MAEKNSRREMVREKSGNGFRISNGPIVRLTEEERLKDSFRIVELPRVHGAPKLFAIARDPKTIFLYWEIDWPAAFAGSPPVDRQVHLRLLRENGSQETTTAVEPMAGSCFLTVSDPRAAYRIEIGYYYPENNWNSVALSEGVKMPPEAVSDERDVDLATIPFHLSFQRLIDLHRASDANALTEIISRLQKQATTNDEQALLSDEEREILRAMKVSVDEIRDSRGELLGQSKETALRKRAEALLGFGATSPAGGFGPSSW